MVNNNKKIKLEEDIAAIRVDARSKTNEASGVALIIPAGEIIELDQEVAPFAGGMQGVMFKGTTHALFLEDLLQRAKKKNVTRREPVAAA
jgi:hypothetical protein